MIDLRESDKNKICEIAKKCFSDKIEIWAYGSRVDGSSHHASDLDLVIRTNDLSSVNTDELVEFKLQLQNSNIPILIQVFDWAQLPNSFHENILKKYAVLYRAV